jgi:Fe-S-cluster containining protein
MVRTTTLHVIENEVGFRVKEIARTHGNWPCRKGCDECCRSLASQPRVTQDEWSAIAASLDALPLETAKLVRLRILESDDASRPIVCPFLDGSAGACLIYEARPVACRTYGFYVERENVLGCHRIAALASESPDVIWGNHAAVDKQLQALGVSAKLSTWLSDADAGEN